MSINPHSSPSLLFLLREYKRPGLGSPLQVVTAAQLLTVTASVLGEHNATAAILYNYISHLFGCSQKASDPDPQISEITKQVEKHFGWFTSKHSDRWLPSALRLPVQSLITGQHCSLHHLFFQVLVSLRNSHIQIHAVTLNLHQNSHYILLHMAHCATNVGDIFTPDIICLFLPLWQESYFNRPSENINLQI